jgi:recombination protein RecT
MTQETEALASPKAEYTLEQWIQSDKFKRNIEAILGTPESVSRFVQIAIGALKRNPKLRECWQPSIFDCLLKLNQIGLEPDGYHAHLVPFHNNKAGGRLESQLIIDYKGLVTVIRRNPEISVVKGAVVYSKDGWSYKEGSNRMFEHTPTFHPPAKDNIILGAYSFVQYKGGDWEVDFLPTWKIEIARAASKVKDGPWNTHYDEMCIKTAHRHHSKTMPLKPEQRLAMAADDDQFEFDPFDNKPKLTVTTPAFLNERSAPQTDQSDNRRTSEDSVQGRTDPVKSGSNEGDTEEPRRAGRPLGAKNKPKKTEAVSSSDRVGEEHDKDVQKDSGDAKAPAEKDYKYGPNDEVSVPVDEAHSGIQENSGQATEERETGEVVAPKLSAKGQELIALLQKHQISFNELMEVLEGFDIDVADAKEKKALVYLPESTLATCVRQWGTILFNIKQRRNVPAQ